MPRAFILINRKQSWRVSSFPLYANRRGDVAKMERGRLLFKTFLQTWLKLNFSGVVRIFEAFSLAKVNKPDK